MKGQPRIILKAQRIGQTLMREKEIAWAQAHGGAVQDLQPAPAPYSDLPYPDLPQCVGKQAFASRAMAAFVISEKRRKAKYGHHIKDRKRQLAAMRPYRCERCDAWHIAGNYKPKAPPKKTSKKRNRT